MPFGRATAALLLVVVVACAGPSAETSSPPDWSPVVQAANEALLNEGQLDRVGEFFTESYGHEGIRSFVSSLRTAFPDLEVEVEILVSSADRVAWVRTHRGTHQGEFRGVPATGRELTWQSMVVSRMEDGRIAEEWSVSQLGGVLRSQ